MGTPIAVSDEALADLITNLTQRGLTITTTKSLAGGDLVACLVDVPGTSHVACGGVCTYAINVRASVLGVSKNQLAATGPVNEQVARQMVRGVCELLRTDISVSTTGVAGPGPADGFPVGTVHVTCAHPVGEEHRLLHLNGQRTVACAGAIDAVTALTRDVLDFAGAQMDS